MNNIKSKRYNKVDIVTSLTGRATNVVFSPKGLSTLHTKGAHYTRASNSREPSGKDVWVLVTHIRMYEILSTCEEEMVCLPVSLFLTNSATNVIWKDWTALSGKMLPCDFRQTVAGNVFTKSYWIIHTYIHRYIRSCQRTKRTVAYGGSFICVQFKVDWRLSLTLIWKVYAVCKNKHIGELYTNSQVAAHVHT